MSKIVLITGFALLLYLNPSISISKECGTCECCFDNPNYKARGECNLTCTVYMDTSKICSIVCDGSPRTELGGTVDYGYLNRMREIRNRMSKVGPDAFYKLSFSREALPYLLRSGYIGLFPPEKTSELEKQVNEIFEKIGQKLVDHFIKGRMMEEHINGIRVLLNLKKIEIFFRGGQRINLFIVR